MQNASSSSASGLFDLSGKAALVTGGGGGLGSSFARTLAEAGATVIVAGRRRAALQPVVDGIVAEGGKAFPVAVDVADAAAVESAFAEAREKAGAIDLLVNNAGVTHAQRFVDTEESAWDAVLDTNLKGAWLMSRAFARHAIAAGRPAGIVNVASILGLRTASEVSAYAVSKAGLVHLTRVLALELARHRIRVNALAPGYVETDLNRDFLQSEAGKAMVRRIPQRRLGLPEDLRGPLLLLASDASSYMTGSVIVVDGGHLVGGV
jgi:NAD(P)-dependent dehydrogenase (short-subunit alcohol dehydrogenase family)